MVNDIMVYGVIFIVTGAPIGILYYVFMRRLEHIKEENGFKDMDSVLKNKKTNH